MAKFAVGEKVTYRRKSAKMTRPSPTVRVTIDKISTSDGITEYKSPLYHISWPPMWKAVVRESQLSREEGT